MSVNCRKKEKNEIRSKKIKGTAQRNTYCIILCTASVQNIYSMFHEKNEKSKNQ